MAPLTICFAGVYSGRARGPRCVRRSRLPRRQGNCFGSSPPRTPVPPPSAPLPHLSPGLASFPEPSVGRTTWDGSVIQPCLSSPAPALPVSPPTLPPRTALVCAHRPPGSPPSHAGAQPRALPTVALGSSPVNCQLCLRPFVHSAAHLTLPPLPLRTTCSEATLSICSESGRFPPWEPWTAHLSFSSDTMVLLVLETCGQAPLSPTVSSPTGPWAALSSPQGHTSQWTFRTVCEWPC